MRIALVGKGGSGKSVIAGTMARLLARQGRQVLALDFDTMPGLAYSLGLARMGNAGLPEDLAVRRKKTGWGLKRRISAATLVKRHAVAGPDGVLFLQLGKLPGGVKPGSSVAFRHVAETFRRPRWVVLGDLAAGTRQCFFGWTGFASIIAIVVDPSRGSILSARRLRGLREAHPESEVGVVVSKVRPDTDTAAIANALELPLWGEVPYDTHVIGAERQGRAVIDLAPHAPAVSAVSDLLSRLLPAAEKRQT